MKIKSKHLQSFGFGLTVVFLCISFWNRYQGMVTGFNFSSVDYFKSIVTASMSPTEIVTNIAYPSNGLFLQNIFLLFPFKFLSTFFSIQFSYALTSFLLSVMSSYFFYKILRRFLTVKASLLLLWLLMFTQTSVSFHEFFLSADKNIGQFGNLALSDFPNPSSIVLGLLVFYHIGVLADAPPKMRTLRICFALLLQVLISPINSIICGFWAFTDYFMSSRSPRFHLTRKIRLTVFIFYSVLIFLQVVKLVTGESESGQSLVTSLLRNQPLQFSFYHLVLYILLPVLLLTIFTKIMNVSWREIIQRFSFIAVLYFLSLASLIYAILLNENGLYEVLNRSGVTPLTNALVYLPVLYLLSEGRYSRLFALRSLLFEKIVRISPLLVNTLVIVLLVAVSVQATWISISAARGQAQATCLNFDSAERLKVENLIRESSVLELEERKELILNYARGKLSPIDFIAFMTSPLDPVIAQEKLGASCSLLGLGYLSLNGLSQSKVSRNRATDLILKFTDGGVSSDK
jgi:hypothetical protein